MVADTQHVDVIENEERGEVEVGDVEVVVSCPFYYRGTQGVI